MDWFLYDISLGRESVNTDLDIILHVFSPFAMSILATNYTIVTIRF